MYVYILYSETISKYYVGQTTAIAKPTELLTTAHRLWDVDKKRPSRLKRDLGILKLLIEVKHYFWSVKSKKEVRKDI